MQTYFKEYMDLPQYAYHQFVGSYLAKKEFGVSNIGIIEAIKYHCTGNSNMGNIAKVVYASDKIEPTRGFDSSMLIKECIKNYETGFIKVLEANREYLLSKNANINDKLTNACMSYYLNK